MTRSPRNEAYMLSRLEQLCLDKGLKMTEQRRVISRVLSAATDHPDVEQVYRRAADIDSKISIATVYRTVRLLEDAGVIERLDFGDGRARFEETRDLRLIGGYRQGADPDLDIAVKQVPVIYEILKQTPSDRPARDSFADLANALKAAANQAPAQTGVPIRTR